METFIVLVSLAASAGGSLVLLSCMAGKRAQLVKAFNIQQELEAREAKIKKNIENNQSQNGNAHPNDAKPAAAP